MARILYIEDDPDSQGLLKAVFRNDDIQVVCVSTYAEAMIDLNTMPSDVFILDFRLSSGNGINLCRQIRAAEPIKPILFLTGSAFDEDRDEAFAAGADDFFTKPVEISVFRELILSMIARPHSGGNNKITAA